MYPESTSTYMFPTGTKVEVPCSAPNNVIEIERTQCPNSFVNPMDINHPSPCINVCFKRPIELSHPPTYSIGSFKHNPPSLTYILSSYTHTQSQSWSQPCPVAVYTDEEYLGMWATHNAIGLIGLQLNIFLIMTWSILRCLLMFLAPLRFICLFFLMRSQGSWGKETIFS
jgi:hypothetical protein